MRASAMEDPARRKELAMMYADGLPRKVMGEALGVHPDTITGWIQRADVRALVSKYIEERSNRVLRHTDKAIEGKLMADKDIELDELLKIRKEFAGSKLEVTAKDGDSAGAIDELMQRLHENPELLEQLLENGA